MSASKCFAPLSPASAAESHDRRILVGDILARSWAAVYERFCLNTSYDWALGLVPRGRPLAET